MTTVGIASEVRVLFFKLFSKTWNQRKANMKAFGGTR